MPVKWKEWYGAESVVGGGNTPNSRCFLKNISVLQSLVLSMNTYASWVEFSFAIEMTLAGRGCVGTHSKDSSEGEGHGEVLPDFLGHLSGGWKDLRR